jgi:NRAMP (natural resistance-associated macrophage protein)-like metal ion transporter
MDQVLEKIAAAPSVVLENGIEATKKFGKDAASLTRLHKAHSFWASLGPGLVTGAADDDPSGIATYSQTGAQYGTQLLWLAPLTFPLMAIVQEMCARIGLATGRGLAGNIRINYPSWVLYLCAILLFVANTLNVGADIGAMAKAIQLLAPSSNFVFLTVSIAIFSVLLQIFTSYERYAQYLKYLVLVLFSYVLSAFMTKLNIHDMILHTIVPHLEFSKDQIILVTAILGTTISPYLFFWQTSQEIEEEILKGKTSIRLREGTTKEEISHMRKDVWSGMFISNTVMFFIIAACAATLYENGITNIQTASDAALALKPIAGEGAYLLFSVGIIGAGLLALPVLAGSAAYTFAETFRWKSGLYRKLKDARAFYGVLMFCMFIGLGINFLGFDPIKLLIYTAVVNGLVAPVILFLIVRMTSNPKIVKDRVNHPIISLLGWFITVVMVLSGIATIYTIFAS